MTDLTRTRKFAEKKTRSVSSARIKYSDVSDTDKVELFNLPANAVIVDSMVVVETAGQTSLTVDYGFDGGAELGNDLDIDGAAVVSGLAPAVAGSVATLTLTEGTPNTLDSGTITGTVTNAPRIATGTGKNVTAKFSAAPTAGEFVFIVEYIEYDLGCGEYTNYTA